MSLLFNNSEYPAVYWNSSLVNNVYFNDSLLWTAIKPPLVLKNSGTVWVPSKTATVTVIGHGGPGGSGNWVNTPPYGYMMVNNWTTKPADTVVKISQTSNMASPFKTITAKAGNPGKTNAVGTGGNNAVGRNGGAGYQIPGQSSLGGNAGYKADWTGSPGSFMSAGKFTNPAPGGSGFGAGGGGSGGGKQAGSAHNGGGSGYRVVETVTSPSDSMYINVVAPYSSGSTSWERAGINAGQGAGGIVYITW